MPQPRIAHAVCAAAGALLLSTACSATAPARAERGEEPRCAAPLASVVLVDDLANAPAWVSDQVREFRIPTPAQALRKALDAGGCLAVLEADPVFASIPAVAQPELVLRARIVELRAAERSMGEKASTAVERYVGSYLGMSNAEVPALGSVTVSVDVICARTRRLAAQVGAQATGAGTSEQNGEALRQAFADAALEVVSSLRKTPPKCEAPQ